MFVSNQCGWTALMWACYKGRDLVVSELLERGANPNVKVDVSLFDYVFLRLSDKMLQTYLSL